MLRGSPFPFLEWRKNPAYPKANNWEQSLADEDDVFEVADSVSERLGTSAMELATKQMQLLKAQRNKGV